MRRSRGRFQLRLFHLWVAFLLAVMAAGAGAAAIVFTRGLVVTNLTDLVPWGLWITLDLSSIALSAGAFSLCAAVYLLGLKRFQPIARTATFVGLVGYSMAMMTLLIDIGKPERFWHSIVFWNPHSVLWEVTMCIVLYFTVLVLEVAPTFGGMEWMQKRLPKVSRLLQSIHHLAPYLALAGLLLSSLHQSSLGATYGVLKARPFWFRPDLSVLFFFSAVIGGVAMTTFISMLAGRLTRRAVVDDALLEKLGQFLGFSLVAYLYFRFWDAFSMTYTYMPGRTEGLRMVTKGPLSFNFWAGEILVGALIPAVILLAPALRRQSVLRMAALAMIVGGVVAYRWDVNLSGQLIVLSYLPAEIVARYTSYFPSLVEFVSGAGVVAYGALAITLGVYYLRIVDHRPAAEVEHAHNRQPVMEPAATD